MPADIVDRATLLSVPRSKVSDPDLADGMTRCEHSRRSDSVNMHVETHPLFFEHPQEAASQDRLKFGRTMESIRDDM